MSERIQEALKSALSGDLSEVFETAERFGLMICIGGSRIHDSDLQIKGHSEVTKQSVKPARKSPRLAKESKPKSRTAEETSGAQGQDCCDVCGITLPVCSRRTNMLCKIHSARWYQHKKQNGTGASPYGSWVEYQKAGGRAPKKA